MWSKTNLQTFIVKFFKPSDSDGTEMSKVKNLIKRKFGLVSV